ncbi:MAG: protein DpdH [Solirubrobacteraceae bacterium]
MEGAESVTSRLEPLASRSAREPFRGFRCWDPDEVGDIMHREAAVPSRAVLLATHQPPHITKIAIAAGRRFAPLEVVSQEECLAAIMRDRDPSLLAPIIGEPGSGKSHLVLWMKAKLEDEAAPNRKIIYLPKGETSLASVIELLLDGRQGGDFDKIRTSVTNATRQMTLAEQAQRLRDELALAIAAGAGTTADPYFDAHRKHIDYLAASLPALLRDPDYDVNLLGEGGVFRRIVEEARTGAREEPAEILPDDLKVTLSEAELHDVSQSAKTVLAALANEKLREVAVAALNAALPRCLSRVFGVEPMQLVGVMRQLRERLFQENSELELILMVEDFTLLQGIQYDLLEAMIELQQRGGRALMCPMKTIMAVTGGFLSRMLTGNDGLRTRIQAQGHVYNLDVAYGGESRDAMASDSLVDFTARYLNAVRLGSATIDALAPDLPNACEGCQHRETCLDAFGTAEKTGYGLYPFNTQALDRMVRSRQDKFNPRDLLSVLVETLTTRLGELADGQFPSQSWARQFDPRDHSRPPLRTLSLPTQQAVEQFPKPEQRAVLLTFWGGVPDQLDNLAPGIHEAFSIPPAEDVIVNPPRRNDDKKPDEPRRDGETDAITRDVLVWRDGDRLEAARALVIRRAFREAIWGQVDPEGSLYSPAITGTVFDKLTDVQITRSGGSGRPDPTRFAVKFEPTNESALLFQAILTAQARQNWSFPGGPQALATFLGRVDVEAARLRAYIEARLVTQRSDRDAATGLLALTGLVAGQGGASSTQLLLSAALSAPAATSDAPPAAWKATVSMTQKHHRVVRDFTLQAAHVSRSTTEPLAVDGSSLASALSALSQDWQIPEVTEAAPRPAQTMQRVLAERLPVALEAVRTMLSDWRAEIGRLVGDPSSISQRARQWESALTTAESAGFLVRTRGPSREFNASHLEATVKVIDAILDGWDARPLGPQIAAAARTPWARLDPLREALVSMRNTIAASIRQADTQVGAGAAGAALARFETRLKNLARAARIADGGSDDN